MEKRNKKKQLEKVKQNDSIEEQQKKMKNIKRKCKQEKNRLSDVQLICMQCIAQMKN